MNRRLAPALVACTLLAGGLGTPAHAATTHEVQVRNNFFQPATVQIQPGDTVVWTAVDANHTVTADDGRFNFHLNTRFQQVSWTAGDTEEHIRYRCTIHGGMTGLITVGDPQPDPPPPLPTLVVPDDVATIAAAASGAQPGTIVLVRPGIYREEVAVTVTVPNLVIRGLGENPAGVVLDGQHTTDVGITIQAPGVRIANLTVASHRHTGVRAEARPPPDGDGRSGGDGAVLSDVVIDDNGYYGVDLYGRSGLTLRNVTATRHTIAGVAVRDCPQCGARLDDTTLERNGVGLLAHDATGLIVRGSTIRDNGAGIVLRDTTAATITANTLSGNHATDVRTASVFTTVPLWTGAGVWVSGGRAHHIHHNTLTGHTYNIAVTGPLPALQTQVRDNTVDNAIHADLGVDALSAGICLAGNQRPDGTEPTSDPPAAQTIYDCNLPTTAGLPYPIVTTNLTAHALRLG